MEGSDVTRVEERHPASQQFRSGSGTQHLVSFSSMQSPLAALPPAATSNLLVISAKSPMTVEGRLRDLGIDPRNVGLVPLAAEDYDYDGPLWCPRTVRPNDLTGLSIAFTEALQHVVPGSGWILVEDLNILLMYASETSICRLLSHLTRRAKSKDVSGIYGVSREAVSDATYSNLRQSVDREVDFRGNSVASDSPQK
jgi:hypothetical protein